MKNPFYKFDPTHETLKDIYIDVSNISSFYRFEVAETGKKNSVITMIDIDNDPPTITVENSTKYIIECILHFISEDEYQAGINHPFCKFNSCETGVTELHLNITMINRFTRDVESDHTVITIDEEDYFVTETPDEISSIIDSFIETEKFGFKS